MAHFRSIAFLMSLLACSMYSYWLSNKDYEWVVPHMNDRAPAAVRNSPDYQNILAKPMRVFKKEAVVASISISEKNGHKYFSIGQFAVGSGPDSNAVCLEYPYVHLKFVAEGAAVNGKETTAWLKAPCLFDLKNRDFLSEVPLPFGDLQRWPAQNQEVDFSSGKMPVKIKFDQVYGDWPTLWHLDSVEFSKEPDGKEKIIFDNYDFMQKNGEPIFVK